MASQHPINMLEMLSDKSSSGNNERSWPGAASSLAEACRRVIVDSMERFPPEAFGILDESEWENIIRLKHKKTRPQKGTGGLDGSGRMVPAINYKFMTQIEARYPHLAESSMVDKMVWKDCVEHKFKAGGVARPPELMYPWPTLVERIQGGGKIVTSRLKEKKGQFDDRFWNAVKMLENTPMNVALLTSTKIGVTVKKFLKNYAKVYPDGHDDDGGRRQRSPEEQLRTVLQRWMTIAEQSGVKSSTTHDGGQGKRSAVPSEQVEIDKGLKLAEKCASWRQLFASLHAYEEEQKSNQGARMRERRKKLNQNRRQIVKVRPSRARHNAILSRSGQSRFGGPNIPSTSGTSKMQQLRMESSVTSSRRQPPPPNRRAAAPAPATRGGGFSAAVAFASASKPSSKRRSKPTVVALGNGKRMKIPGGSKSSQHTSNLKKRLGMLKRPPR